MMENLYEKIQESADYIKSRWSPMAKTAIVLGTGLGDFTHEFSNTQTIQYSDIPFFPQSTVQSHAGQLVYGFIEGKPIIAMAGRFHYYEGYSAAELTFPIRVLKALGIEHIILTNAAGGINPHFAEGDIVIVNDHINMLPGHPLRGQNDIRLGVRFPDMMEAYDREYLSQFQSLARCLFIDLKTGVYLGLQGPSLETPAEYKMAHILGADLVGMSTIPEVIVARHSSMKVTVFSIVSNVCFPTSVLTETTVDEVIAVVNRSAKKLQILLKSFLSK